MAPGPPAAAWNVLRFDGITQFYPWRLEAARQVRAGRVPLWNPHQFAAEGGTPLLANAQSAPLYPLTVVFYAMPLGVFWYAFGLSAALHLLLAALGMYLFLRALPVGRAAALLGAATWTLSGPITTWLALPTFLAVGCWLPWLLLLVKRAHQAAGGAGGRHAALGAGAVAGTLLLAGHLQIAFYCLLAAGLYSLWCGAATRTLRRRPAAYLLAAASAITLAFLLAAPQLLPALELGRVSHRAAGNGPSEGSYAAYSTTALPLRNLVTLLVPDFFGHPNAGTYWNTNNYAEWALYVGVLPLALAVYTLVASDRPARVFFVLLGLLGFSMALGTPINRLFFWGVPGFAQTGSPARALLLVAFALATLAALGLELLQGAGRSSPARHRAGVLAAIATPVLLAAVGAQRALPFASEALPSVPFAQLLADAGVNAGIWRAGVLLGLAAAALITLGRVREQWRSPAAALCVVIAAGDLLAWGAGYNPTSPPSRVYPPTPGITWLQKNANHALIAPLNRSWSLSAQPPRGAVLPPNAATVYSLHDLSGYDSLFPGSAKQRVRTAGDGIDPSPPENGNMVFVKSVRAAQALGARFVVVAPGAAGLLREAADTAGLRRVYAGEDLVIFEDPQHRREASQSRRVSFAPASFLVGLFLGLCGLATLAAAAAIALVTRQREGRQRAP